MSSTSSLPERVRADAQSADIITRAPGRANLIGEHTDYNHGFVLPVALDLATYVIARSAKGTCMLRSLERQGRVEVDILSGDGPTEGWGRYVTAVVHALLDEGIHLRGLDGYITTDVPVGAGLSSSAAFEVALATALTGGSLDAPRMARICQRAENSYVGVESGIMDQLASAACRTDHALLVDCRDNSIEHVRVPDALAVLVVDSGAHRGLQSSAFNERRAECRAACKALRVESLRDADLGMLEGADMDEVLWRRARHVVTEDRRVTEAAEALQSTDLRRLRQLFAESHRSLADDYEVSIPELNTLVAIADRLDGVHGARLTGAGFGGCTVNLVDVSRAQEIGREVVRRYEAETSKRARFWISRPATGTEVIRGARQSQRRKSFS